MRFTATALPVGYELSPHTYLSATQSFDGDLTVENLQRLADIAYEHFGIAVSELHGRHLVRRQYVELVGRAFTGGNATHESIRFIADASAPPNTLLAVVRSIS